MNSTTDSGSIFDQPRAVWAVAFACVVAFMGIGLVDPILPTLASELDASPSEVSLLFTTYFGMTGLSMFVSGWVASRIGPRRTLLAGLALVVLFSALAGLSGSVFEIAGFRLGWGLGNALFIATALSVIVGAASGGLGRAIILYEAALGLGIASGPLLGGMLGGISWRGPFFGTAALMAIGFVLIAALLGDVPKPERKLRLSEPLRALAHPGLRSMAIIAVLYNFGFFTILAYTPFPLGLSTHQLGLVYFGWGLLVALTSVVGAQRLERRFGLVTVLAGGLAGVSIDLLLGGVFVDSQLALILVVVASGALLGVVNTVITEGVMATAVVERPIASSAYSFVRFTGGAIAPYVAGKLGEHVSTGAPMYLGAGMVALSVVALALSKGHLAGAGEPEIEESSGEYPVPAGVLLALPFSRSKSVPIVSAAARVARARETGVLVAHVRETRPAVEDAADLERPGDIRFSVQEMVDQLQREGIPASSVVLHVTGHHDVAAEALIDLADRTQASAVVVGRPGRHPSEPGTPSVATVLSERAHCDVVVVADHDPVPA